MYELDPQPGWSVVAVNHPGSGGGVATTHYWPNFAFDDAKDETINSYPATNSVTIGTIIFSNCGEGDGHLLIKHFSIEEGFKTQAEVEALVVNNAALTVDCSYYKSAFEFVAGVATDNLGGSLTLSIGGTVTVPPSNDGIEVDNTDSITLDDFFLTEDFMASFQVVFTGEIVGNSGDFSSIITIN